MIDFEALLVDPLYDGFGIAARLDLGVNGVFDLTVIDHSKGVVVDAKLPTGGERGMSPVQVQSIRPCAAVRASELRDKSIDRAWLQDVSITLFPSTANEKTWTVVTHAQKPGRSGENSGQLYLFLMDAPNG